MERKRILFNCSEKATGVIPSGVIYIGRGSKWGNPFIVGRDGDRDEVIAKFDSHLREMVKTGEVSLEDLASLYNKPLLCHCYPKSCHGNVLIKASRWAYKQLLSNKE